MFIELLKNVSSYRKGEVIDVHKSVALVLIHTNKAIATNAPKTMQSPLNRMIESSPVTKNEPIKARRGRPKKIKEIIIGHDTAKSA